MEYDPVQRALRGLAFALAAALCVAFGYWMLSPGGGPDEFARARQALREARSWKLTFTGTMAGQSSMVAEVSCPDAHVIRKSLGPVTTDIAPYLEYIVKDGVIYRRKAPDAAWDIVEEAFGFEAVCSQIHKGAESPDLLPPFHTLVMAARMKIERGEAKTIGEEACRVWKVVPLLEAEAYRKEEICLGEDRLPRERIIEHGYLRYSNWNQPITIAPPSGNIKPKE